MAHLNGNLDILLIFAGLFSAVNTSFCTMSIANLSPDPADTSNQLLRLIVVQSSNDTLTTADLYPPFSPAAHDIRVNCLFFASLSCSLLSAGGAVVAKQWLQHYERTGQTGSMDKQGVLRTEKFLGAQRWRLRQLVDALPMLLQLSLCLFFFGLINYLWTINQQTALVVLVLVTSGMILCIAATLTAAISVHCPYQTIPAAYLRYCGEWLHNIGQNVACALDVRLSSLDLQIWKSVSKRWKGPRGKRAPMNESRRSCLVHAHSVRWLMEYSAEGDDVVVAADNIVLLSDVDAVKLVGDNASFLPLIHRLRQSTDSLRSRGDGYEDSTHITLVKAVAHILMADPLAYLTQCKLLLRILDDRQGIASDESKILRFIVSALATQCYFPSDPLRAAENYPELRMITGVSHDTLLVFLHFLSISNVVPVIGFSDLFIAALQDVFSVDGSFADVRVLSLCGLIISRWFREPYVRSPSWDVRVAKGWEARHSFSQNGLALNAKQALRTFCDLTQRVGTPSSYECKCLISFLRHYRQHISSWRLVDTRWRGKPKTDVDLMLSCETANDLISSLLQATLVVARARRSLVTRSTRTPLASKAPSRHVPYAEVHRRVDTVDDSTLIELQRQIVMCLDTIILPDDMHHLRLVVDNFDFVQGVLDLAVQSDADREVAMRVIHRVLRELWRDDKRLDPRLFCDVGTIKLIEEHPSLLTILAQGLRATSSESAKVFYAIARNFLTGIMGSVGGEGGGRGGGSIVAASDPWMTVTNGAMLWGTSIASLLFKAELGPAFMCWLRTQSLSGLIDGDMCLGLWWMAHVVRRSDWSAIPWADQLMDADVLGVFLEIVAACIPVEEAGGMKAKSTLDSAATLVLTVWHTTVRSRGTDGCYSRWVSDATFAAMANCIEYVLKPHELVRTPILRYIGHAFNRRPYSAAAARLDVVLEESLLRISQLPQVGFPHGSTMELREREAAAIRHVRASIASWNGFRDSSTDVWWKRGGLAVLHDRIELP
ncbi:hypothetical protein FRB95_007132 [Tulasnella sp. JGI-2019a]|nr:hypothetical protein FRB95_007132 [Tulasnella sp. JGI-2019a]